MTDQKGTWGGSRGGGRPHVHRHEVLNCRISKEAKEWLATVADNKSEYIDQLLLTDKVNTELIDKYSNKL